MRTMDRDRVLGRHPGFVCILHLAPHPSSDVVEVRFLRMIRLEAQTCSRCTAPLSLGSCPA